MYSHGQTNSRDVAVLFSGQLNYEINNITRDDEGRYIVIYIDIDDTQFILVNVYAPTKDNVDGQYTFFNQLKTSLAEYNGENLVIGGDFNAILNSTLDKKVGGGIKILIRPDILTT